MGTEMRESFQEWLQHNDELFKLTRQTPEDIAGLARLAGFEGRIVDQWTLHQRFMAAGR